MFTKEKVLKVIALWAGTFAFVFFVMMNVIIKVPTILAPTEDIPHAIYRLQMLSMYMTRLTLVALLLLLGIKLGKK